MSCFLSQTLDIKFSVFSSNMSIIVNNQKSNISWHNNRDSKILKTLTSSSTAETLPPVFPVLYCVIQAHNPSAPAQV